MGTKEKPTPEPPEFYTKNVDVQIDPYRLRHIVVVSVGRRLKSGEHEFQNFGIDLNQAKSPSQIAAQFHTLADEIDEYLDS